MEVEKTKQTSPVTRLALALSAIETSVVNNECAAREALDRIVAAVSELDEVSAVAVAVDYSGEFVICANAGKIGAEGTYVDCVELYTQCMNSNRLLRCEDVKEDRRFSDRALGDAVSLMLLPLTQHRSPVGVLAIFSPVPHGLNVQHILALSTAATLCGMLLPEKISEIGESAKESAVPTGAPTTSSHDLAAVVNSHELTSEMQVASRSDVPVCISEPIECATELALAAPPSAELATLARALAAQAKEPPNFPSSEIGPRNRSNWIRVAALVAVSLLTAGAIGASVYAVRKQPLPQTTAEAGGPRKICEVTPQVGQASLAAHNLAGVGGALAGGRLLANQLPGCPAAAMSTTAEDRVDAVLSVNSKGAVEAVRVVGGGAMFQGVTVAALSRWQFAPFVSGGDMVNVDVPVSLVFRHAASATNE